MRQVPEYFQNRVISRFSDGACGARDSARGARDDARRGAGDGARGARDGAGDIRWTSHPQLWCILQNSRIDGNRMASRFRKRIISGQPIPGLINTGKFVRKLEKFLTKMFSRRSGVRRSLRSVLALLVPEQNGIGQMVTAVVWRGQQRKTRNFRWRRECGAEMWHPTQVGFKVH